MYTKGAVPETRAALASALEIAERLGDTDYQLRALWGLCVDRLNNAAVSRGAGARAAVLRAGGELARSADRRSHDGPVAALPGRPVDCAAALRAHAQPLRRARAPLAHHPLSVRPAGDGAHRAGGGAVDTGLSRIRPCAPSRATSTRRVALHHALSLCNALAKALPGGAPGRRPGGRGALRRHAARSRDPQRARLVADRGPLLPGRAADQARRLSPTACRRCAPRSRSCPRSTSRCATPRCSASWRKRWAVPGKSLKASRRSTRRWSDPSATRSAGASPSCCASRASWCCSSRAPKRRRGGRGTFPAGARLGAPAGRPVLGAALRDEPRPAVARARAEASQARAAARARCTAASPRASPPPTSSAAKTLLDVVALNPPPARPGMDRDPIQTLAAIASTSHR